MLGFIAKIFFQKANLTPEDLAKVAEGKALPSPDLSVLDIGFGFGKWAFLIRDTFDVMVAQHFVKNDWKIHITGVEPFEKCITSIQKELYNEIIKDDIRNITDKLGQYDLIIMGDVIEHLERDEAKDLLKKLFEHTNNIIVSTPLGFMPQADWAGNKYEIHRSGWQPEDFSEHTIVEQHIVSDKVFSPITAQIPEMKDHDMSNVKLLTVWLQP